MLLLEERQIFGCGHGPAVGEVESGSSVLALADIQWVLSESQRVACCASAEDFADVISGLAPCVACPNGQLLEQIIGTELGLDAMII